MKRVVSARCELVSDRRTYRDRVRGTFERVCARKDYVNGKIELRKDDSTSYRGRW